MKHTDLTINGMETRTVRFTDIQDFLLDEYAKARKTKGLSQRWKNALDRAWSFFLTHPVISYDPDTGAILYSSESTTGVVYHANGTCQCEAYASGQPCKHRAAGRLLQNALKAHDRAYSDYLDKLAEQYEALEIAA